MIETIIEYINNRIETLDSFQELRGLCEIIERENEGKSEAFPAEYCRDGEYKRVEDYDLEKGVVYHRLTGKPTEERVESTVGCETNIRRTYPLRVVAVVSKNILKKKNNNSYIDDKLASNLSNIISKSSVKTLAVAVQAEDVEVSTNSYNINRYDLWNEEHKNINEVIDFEYSYIAVDYSVIVEGSRDCFHIFDCDTQITLEE
jgi:hypothetical protein